MGRLQDKIADITGIGGGMGREAARRGSRAPSPKKSAHAAPTKGGRFWRVGRVYFF